MFTPLQYSPDRSHAFTSFNGERLVYLVSPALYMKAPAEGTPIGRVCARTNFRTPPEAAGQLGPGDEIAVRVRGAKAGASVRVYNDRTSWDAVAVAEVHPGYWLCRRTSDCAPHIVDD